MSKKNALINTEMLSWARNSAGLTKSDAALKVCGGDVAKLEAWESGDEPITIAQCGKLNELYKVPLAVFYLKSPPEGMRIIKDFRTQSGEKPPEHSEELRSVSKQLVAIQSWLSDYHASQGGVRKPFVGSFSVNASPQEVASSIRKTLKLRSSDVVELTEARLAFNYFRGRAEKAGVFVFKFSGVESEEARGIALPDPLAPVVYINPKDSWTGQRFTLAHELAHIWIGKEGISSLFSNRKIEVFCNQVASHVLLPGIAFKNAWRDSPARDKTGRISFIAKRFHVSREVVARKALDFGIISENQYGQIRIQCRSDWEKSEQSTGGNYYTNQVSRYGREFIGLVMNGCQGGSIALGEASRVLGTKVNNFGKLCDAAKVGFKPTGAGE